MHCAWAILGALALAFPRAQTASPADAPLAAWRVELLDAAFRAASAMPLKPHVKNRSRAQEAVARACFDLDQPRRALACGEAIENWRRGVVIAEFALHCAQRGETRDVQRHLDLAQRISEGLTGEDAQDWQQDRIRAAIAKTHLWLGHSSQAESFAAGLDASEAREVEAMRAASIEPEAFDEHLKSIEAVVATGSFDPVRNALDACARLFDRFYADETRRERAEGVIRASWAKLPVTLRIELLAELGESALGHGDRSRALTFVGDARVMLEGARLSAEHSIPPRARLAAIGCRAGDVEGARRQIDAALAAFDSERTTIADAFRAKSLRPIAEAYAAMGDTDAALRAYRRAVEAGVENPNSRPRAEDVSATCCSMAVHGVEPDAELRARIAQIVEALGEPW